jgi:hypothetical protein
MATGGYSALNTALLVPSAISEFAVTSYVDLLTWSVTSVWEYLKPPNGPFPGYDECTGTAFRGCTPNSLVADEMSFPSAHVGPFTMPCQVRYERLALSRIARVAIDDAGCNGLLVRIEFRLRYCGAYSSHRNDV